MPTFFPHDTRQPLLTTANPHDTANPQIYYDPSSQNHVKYTSTCSLPRPLLTPMTTNSPHHHQQPTMTMIKLYENHQPYQQCQPPRPMQTSMTPLNHR